MRSAAAAAADATDDAATALAAAAAGATATATFVAAHTTSSPTSAANVLECRVTRILPRMRVAGNGWVAGVLGQPPSGL